MISHLQLSQLVDHPPLLGPLGAIPILRSDLNISEIRRLDNAAALHRVRLNAVVGHRLLAMEAPFGLDDERAYVRLDVASPVAKSAPRTGDQD
jgi:hypothetical protein